MLLDLLSTEDILVDVGRLISYLGEPFAAGEGAGSTGCGVVRLDRGGRASTSPLSRSLSLSLSPNIESQPSLAIGTLSLAQEKERERQGVIGCC